MNQRKILVTAALPYANGPIHLGHLVEFIQTDIWVRFQKLRGHRCIFIWADDTHGTAIMIRARAEGRTEEEVIAQASEEHQRDFQGFQIEYATTAARTAMKTENFAGKFGNRFAMPDWSKRKKSSSFTMSSKELFWLTDSSSAHAPYVKRPIKPVTTVANAVTRTHLLI